jgi:serine phosphatase RsbU (regulator of sigma subunit)
MALGFLSSVFSRKAPAPREALQADTPHLQGAEIAAAYFGQRMGGDLYDFLRVHPKRVLFGLLDVAGRVEDNHDIVAAVQAEFRALGTELLSPDDANEAEAMGELCLRLNQTLIKAANGVRPCPAFAACYNEDLGVLCYFNAGHTPGMVRDSQGVSELPATGLPLGLFTHVACDAAVVALEPDAALMLVSRGVVEGRCKGENAKGEEFGLERAKISFENMKPTNAREMALAMLKEMQQFMCTPPTHNDVTALTLLRDPANGVHP